VSEGPDDVEELFAQLPDPTARAALAERFLPLAENLARKFSGRGESLEDLTQVASLGLVHAIDRFDPDHGARFSTFAAATIVGELKRHFRDRGWSVRVPRSLQESALLLNRTVAAAWQELGRSPTIAELSARADLSEDEVIDALEALQAYSTASLDAPVGEDGGTVGATIGDRDAAFEVAEGWASIEPALRELPERERRILYLRFFEGMTQSEIADEVGISQMHVSRMITQSLRAIRESQPPGAVPDDAER
jgi:RNA polymerase sigma-B factor